MPAKSWEEIGLSEHVLSGIQSLGFKTLTPVQASCIPLFLSKKDVAVEAVTGSGKTLAFLVPMFESLLKHSFRKLDVGAIIISPTRELACQTEEVVQVFLEHMPMFSSMLLIGGEAVATDIKKLHENGANIIVATPGRLADLFSHTETLKLAACVKTLEVLILDEADKLLDMGFEKTINTILGYLPKQRQTGLFSATQTKEMDDLIRAGLRSPFCISVKEKGVTSTTVQRTPTTLSNFYMVCEADKKLSTLVWFLKSKVQSKCMVFFSTCAAVEYFSCILNRIMKHVPILCIHGKMKKKRHKIFSEFRSKNTGILLCTDVMARGVDIPDVQWVMQFDPPSSASSFVHRCGRTARIGKTGSAVVMLLPNETTFINFLVVNQKVTLEEIESPDVPDIAPKIRKLSIRNRDIYEKGLRAFVSFIRFYTKHECNLLFRIKDLDFGQLANGYALLKLPRMPELKNKIPPNFVSTNVDFNKIPYQDKNREKQRQIKLEELKNNPPKAFSTKKTRLLREKKLKSKKLLAKKKRKLRDTEEDLDELARDARLCKKFKKGKISKEDFDAQFAPDLCKD